jgi:transposase
MRAGEGGEDSVRKTGKTTEPTIDLDPAMRSQLERIVSDGPVNLARRVRIILACGDDLAVTEIAQQVGLHRDSVRRWIVRFREHGLAGLQHGNLGRPKNVVFHPGTRQEIRRRASLSPSALGEPITAWSLYKLRRHLLRERVVRSISIESLRLILREGPYSRRYWAPTTQSLAPLRPEDRARLLRLAEERPGRQAQRARAVLTVADGVSISKAASALRVDKNTLRRWLKHFRASGIAGLVGGQAASFGGSRSSPEPGSPRPPRTGSHQASR